MKKIYIAAGFTALLFTACKPKLDPSSPQSGTADFSTYLAVGNSLTAGYADGTLYRSGQESSYPSMLAAQFKLVGGGDFKQPLLNGNAGYPSPKRVLGYATDCKGVTSISPVLYTGVMDTAGDGANISAQGPFNNVGVPGIRCIDYGFAGYGYVNPYARRFYSSPLTEKPLDEALKIKATFFSCWLGSNDVLGYATSGGSGTVGGIGTSDISPLNLFTGTYNTVISALTANGAKGVLMSIPDVTAIPFFTTVPANGLVLDQTQAAQLSAAYQPLGISFTAGQNYFIIQDASAPGGVRKAKAGELILLTVPQDSLKCAGWGSIKPIPKQFVLDATEVANVQNATAEFNAVIKQAAADHDLAYVDMTAFLRTVASGIVFNGVNFNTTFVQGGTFSLDGVHLTPRGYAIVANGIINEINSYYKSSIPSVDVNKYSGLKFP